MDKEDRIFKRDLPNAYMPDGVKYCSKCKTTEGQFIKNSKDRNTGKQYYRCVECNTSAHKAYRQTPEGKATTKKARENYESNNPARRKAWRAAQGLEKKPCLVCGEEKVDAHHDDPNKPKDVIYLCRTHHAERHKRARITQIL